MDEDAESAALYHQWELEQQELEKAIDKLEKTNERQNKRFNLQEKIA